MSNNSRLARAAFLACISGVIAFSRAAVAKPALQADYHLVAIDSVPPASWSRPSDCFEVPATATYRFSGTRWVSRDSARAGPVCPTDLVRVDSGYFRISADTIDLFVDDSKIGVNGLVLRGRTHGDTLTFW